MGKSAKTYLIYDGRAAGGDTNDALVYSAADTLREARRDKRDMFPDGVIFEVDKDGNETGPIQ